MDAAPSSIFTKIRTLLPLLLICTILVGLVMFAAVNLVPHWKTYQDLQSQADTGNLILATLTAAGDDSSAAAILQHRVETIQTDLVKNSKLFMSPTQADAILQKFYEYAKESNVEVKNLQTQNNLDPNASGQAATPTPRPNKQNNKEPAQTVVVGPSAYTVRALRLTVTGTVQDLIHYLTRIREIGVAGIVINNLSIKEAETQALLMMDILIYTSSLSDGTAYENLPEVVLPTPLFVAIDPTNVPATPIPETILNAGATVAAPETTAGGTGSISIVAKDAIPPEPTLNAVFTDNFDSGNLNHWKLGAGWILFDAQGAKALQTTDNSGDATFAYDTLDNAAVELRVLMSSSSIKLTIRQSSAGYYAVVLQPTGQVALYRGSTLVKSTATDQSSIGRWRVLRLSAVEGIVRVSVDGIEVLTARDTSELPPGTFAFSSIGRGIVRVDDVQVWSLDTTTPF